MSDAISVKKIQEKEDILPNPAKAGDGKLKGLTIPMVGSQLPGSKETRQKRLLPQDGENNEELKKSSQHSFEPADRDEFDADVSICRKQ